MKRILAFDLASSTGWAYDSASGLQFGEKKFVGHAPEKFVQFNQWLDTFPEKRIGLIAYEKPHFRGYPATFLLVGFATRVEEFAYRRGIKCVGLHSGTMKLHITGSGRAEKTDVIAAVKKRFKIDKALGDDEADALSCLAYAQDKL